MFTIYSTGHLKENNRVIYINNDNIRKIIIVIILIVIKIIMIIEELLNLGEKGSDMYDK